MCALRALRSRRIIIPQAANTETVTLVEVAPAYFRAAVIEVTAPRGVVVLRRCPPVAVVAETEEATSDVAAATR